MRELAPVLAFYEQYEAFVRDGGGAADATPSGSSLSCVKTTSRFALLTHLLARGNTTVFELLRGHVPSRIESLVPQPTTPAAVPPTAAPPKGEQSTANSAADEVRFRLCATLILYTYLFGLLLYTDLRGILI